MRPTTPRSREPLGWRLFPWAAYLLLVAIKISWFATSALGYTSEDERIYLFMAKDIARGTVYASTHYPPFHPLALAPIALLDEPYRVGIALMALWSSALVFGIWLIARELVGIRHAAAITAISCLMPFHYTVSRTLMSENTYYPLLMLAVYMVITRRWEREALRDALTGALIAVLMLTRYATLVLIPGLAIGWLLRERVRTGRWLPDRGAVLRAVLLTATALVVFAPWPIIHSMRGVALRSTVGADIGLGAVLNPAQLTFDRLAAYFALYLSSWALWLTPVVGLVGVGALRIWRDRLEGALSRLTATALAMFVPLLIVVARHSWRVRYNFPDPLRIQDRYSMYVVGVGIIIGYAVAVIAPGERRLTGWLHWLITLVAPAAVLSAAWWIVLRWGFIPMPLATVPNSIAGDTYHVYVMGGWFWPIMIGSLLSTAWLLWRRDSRTVIAAALSLVLFFAAGVPLFLSRLDEGLSFKWHARALGEVVTRELPELEAVTVVVSRDVIDRSGNTERQFLRGTKPNLELWSGKPSSVGLFTNPDFHQAPLAVFTAEEYFGPTLRTYEVKGNEYVYVLR